MPDDPKPDEPEKGTCIRCEQEVVKMGWFWVLPSEYGGRMASVCPAVGGGLHEVEDDEL